MQSILSKFNIEGKKAIVTGAAKGISYGIAEALHSAGVEVVLIDIVDTVYKSAEKLTANREANVFGVKGDLGIEESRNKAFHEALSLLGGTVDILVNGAGVQHRCEAVDFPHDQWEKVININLSVVFYMCQLAGKVMLRKRYGKIINIASMLTFFGGIMIPAYAASKGGIAQLTKALSNEWVEKGVNVNAIAPGYMETDMTADISLYPQLVKDITKRIPIGRWGNANDVKGLVLFLSSDASRYLSGAVIPVDGGYLSR